MSLILRIENNTEYLTKYSVGGDSMYVRYGDKCAIRVSEYYGKYYVYIYEDHMDAPKLVDNDNTDETYSDEDRVFERVKEFLEN